MVLTYTEIDWDLDGVEKGTNKPYGDNAKQVNAMTAGGKIWRVEM